MPRISEQARQERREAILGAAREQFAANGFHATSMDDILRAAGISAGGAYRYFAGKDEIIAAVATDVVSRLTAEVDRLLADDQAQTLDDAVRSLVGIVDRIADGPGRLALAVWGEAQRDPAIAELARAEGSQVRASIHAFAVRADRAGELPDGVTPDDLASVLFALLPGFLVARRVIGDVDAEAFASAVTNLVGADRGRRRGRPRRP